MFKIVSTVVIDGYGSGETDFLTQLDRVPDSVREEFNNLIFFRLELAPIGKRAKDRNRLFALYHEPPEPTQHPPGSPIGAGS